jgi:hypothetical protein
MHDFAMSRFVKSSESYSSSPSRPNPRLPFWTVFSTCSGSKIQRLQRSSWYSRDPSK